MNRNTLGRTGIEVSALCLGTMTFGTQTSAEDSHAQIDRALEAGIDFLDTAEMYPVNPVRPETTGKSEKIIGDWIAKSGRRDEIVVATKHSGAGFKGARDGAPISGETIPEAIEGSLKRLRTDHIDLYQFHWPNRGSYHFRQNWRYDPSTQDTAGELETLEAVAHVLKDLVAEGKIRAFGLSNDTAWGTMQWLRLSRETGCPRVATMQNEYSLLCRHYDTDMAELSVHEEITLFAYSPLAAGLLSGKYQGGAVPEGSRLSRSPGLGGRLSERALPAVEAYHEVAAAHGLDPVQMALAFLRTRPVPTIPIIGATDPAQLKRSLVAADVTLGEDVLTDIALTHKAHPMPF